MDKKYTALPEGNMGEYRKFTFSEKDYKIVEIIEKPKIKLQWTWENSVCPHCKKRIERDVEHSFYKIEILIDDSKEENNIKEDDILLLGDTIDRRKMLFPKNKYKEVLKESKKFNKLMEDK